MRIVWIGYHIFFHILPSKPYWEYIFRALDTQEKIKVVKAEIKYLTSRVDTLSEILENSPGKSGETGKSKLEINYSEVELKGLVKEVLKANRDIHIKNAKISHQNRKNIALSWYMWFVIIIAFISLFVGLKLSFYGFTNWYFKVQKATG